MKQINLDKKKAMKDDEKVTLSTIRKVKAYLQNEAIKLKKDLLSEEEELTVLARELKQRKDSLHEFEEAGRQDLVEKLHEEIKVIQSYMPEQLSEQEIEQIVQQTIEEVQAESKKDMGKVMGALMPKIKGRADGSKVNQLVQKYLS